MTTLDDILRTLASMADIEGVSKTYDYQPATLGTALPAVTVRFIGIRSQGVATGPTTEFTYEFRVALYLNLDDWQRAQRVLTSLYPRLLGAFTADPGLGCIVDWSEVEDDEDPIFDVPRDDTGKPLGGALLRKSFRIRTVTLYTP